MARRETILEWQFPTRPRPDDPDAANVSKDPRFPDRAWNISGYYEKKAEGEKHTER